jgi:hypothetical protein
VPSVSAGVSQVSSESTESSKTVAITSGRSRDDVMKLILQCMDQIETELKGARGHQEAKQLTSSGRSG